MSKESFHSIKALGWQSWNVSKKGISAVKRVIDTTRTVLAFLCSIGWIAILIILLIALIGGIFMTGSSSSGSGNQLSKEVIEYTPTIQMYANEYEIPHFVNALQAIMMQESGGISDHVGIAEKVENIVIYTIERNSSDQCKQNTYIINSTVIYGYGVTP